MKLATARELPDKNDQYYYPAVMGTLIAQLSNLLLAVENHDQIRLRIGLKSSRKILEELKTDGLSVTDL